MQEEHTVKQEGQTAGEHGIMEVKCKVFPVP